MNLVTWGWFLFYSFIACDLIFHNAPRTFSIYDETRGIVTKCRKGDESEADIKFYLATDATHHIWDFYQQSKMDDRWVSFFLFAQGKDGRNSPAFDDSFNMKLMSLLFDTARIKLYRSLSAFFELLPEVWYLPKVTTACNRLTEC